MTTKEGHQGIVVPMISPVTAERELDETGVRQVVDHLASVSLSPRRLQLTLRPSSNVTFMGLT